jgi:MFS family permease
MQLRIFTPPWPLLLGASSLLFLMMVASYAPTPLYPLYQEQWGLTDSQIGLAFSVYAASVVVILLFLGGMSDRYGRRNTLLIATLTLGAALIILACATTFPLLLLGRFIQGISAALATGAAAATLMESHPGGLARGALLNTFSVAIGAAVGPIMAGSFAAGSSYPLVVPYLIIAAFVPVPLLFLIRATDSAPKQRAARLLQAIRVPRHIWAPFSVAAAALIGTNLCIAIYGSFGSNIAASVGWTTEVLSGLLVSIVLVMFAVVQPFSRNVPPKISMFAGIVLSVIGWAMTSVAAMAAISPLMLIGAITTGGGAGLCLMGAAALVGMISPLGRSAEIYSAFLLIAYITIVVAALIAGPLIGLISISAVLIFASLVCVLLTIYVVYGSRRWLMLAH